MSTPSVFSPPPSFFTPSPSPSPPPPPRPSNETTAPLMQTVIWTLVGVSALFLALRLYCKHLAHRCLWYDDHVLVAAWLALAADAGLNTYNLTLGFGSHRTNIPSQNLPTIGLLSNLSWSLAILGAVWSKTSFGMTLLRITEGATKACVWFIIVTMNLAMTISVLVTWIQCNPVQRGWDITVNGICWDARVNVYYGVFAAVYSGVADVVLALLPWVVIWGLQMRRKEKAGVGVAMGMGVFAGCAAFIKSSKIPLVLDGDFTYEGYDLVIWGAAEVAITICAASVPLLRVLVREVRNRTTQRRYGYHATHNTAADNKESANNMKTSEADDDSFHSKSYGAGTLNRQSTVVVTAGPESQWKLDFDPGSYPGAGIGSDRIVQTHQITVQYHRRDSNGIANTAV
ncbi:hypothetical protein OQA88_8037 [Cercophora sp. LCS_1]